MLPARADEFSEADPVLGGDHLGRFLTDHERRRIRVTRDAVKEGGLTILLEGFEPPPLPVNIVYLGGGRQPLKVRAFVDFAAPQLKARLASDLASQSP
jgi:DNA-binding transcriptional LysR family regulator